MEAEEQIVTIEEVAKSAGVSVSTVSRTINNKPDVAQATKQRIRETMDRLGYTPHRYASNLAGGLSRTVGLLLPISEGGIRQLILDFVIGASRALEERDFLLNVITREMDAKELRALPRKSQIDGVILMRTQLEDSRVLALQSIHLPFVLLGRCRKNEGLSYVDLDFYSAMEKSLSYLKELGHRHIGFITYAKAQQMLHYTYVHLTMRAFEQVSQNLELVTTMIASDPSAESVASSTRTAIMQDPNITAILTVYGELVTVIEKVLTELDRPVPKKTSLIAMTEDKTAERMAPALTSVTFPSEEMGYFAANMLVDRILSRTQGTETKQLLIQPTLTERETTGYASPNRSV